MEVPLTHNNIEILNRLKGYEGNTSKFLHMIYTVRTFTVYHWTYSTMNKDQRILYRMKYEKYDYPFDTKSLDTKLLKMIAITKFISSLVNYAWCPNMELTKLL